MVLGNEPRALNILQMEVCLKNTHIGQICLFSNFSDGPVAGINCCVAGTYLDLFTRGCRWTEECKTSCKCVDSLGLETVFYENGVAIDLVNDQTYIMVFDLMDIPFLLQMDIKIYRGKTLVIKMDGYALSLFLYLLKQSYKYVDLVNNYLCGLLEDTRMFVRQLGVMSIMSHRCKISLQEPDSHLLDLAWARRAFKTVQELHQLQSTMSWLSTLGGAFSALGEEQQKCAMTAGRISMEQLRLALRMGDKIVVAQCKLYFSLSLIQRGSTSRARVIIYEQFMNQKNSRVPDVKTMNMCKGIWSRLKHAINQRRRLKGRPLKGRPMGVAAAVKSLMERWP